MNKKISVGFSDLDIFCIIGVLEKERIEKQKISISLQVSINIDFDDDIDKTIDYRKLKKICIDQAENGKFQLIEILANQIAENVLLDFEDVLDVCVHVKKYALSKCMHCFAELEMKR
jgi:7,8-dihydroneopterin aldolase/epimerase/oxygenase